MGILSKSSVGMLGLIPAKLGSTLLSRLLVGLLSSFALLYLLFQKKLLPKPMAKTVSKLLFYPTFPITAMLRLGNYWTKVDETLFLGCAPMGLLGHPNSFSKMGVKGVINMCYEYPGPKSYYDELGIVQLRLPTVDHFEPSADQLEEAIKFIKHYQKKGEKVYVHCKAGHGRAASVALSWLIHENPTQDPKDLNHLLKQKRKVRGTLFKQKSIVELTNRLRSGKSSTK